MAQEEKLLTLDKKEEELRIARIAYQHNRSELTKFEAKYGKLLVEDDSVEYAKS